MPTEIDPINTDFSPDAGILEQEMHALATLKKIREGEQLDPKNTADGWLDVAVYAPKKDHLKRNLESYLHHRRSRGEVPFAYAPEAKARLAAENTEVRANKIAKMTDALRGNDESFMATVKANGDLERFNEIEKLMPHGKSYKGEYIKEQAYKSFGFSGREIESGFAEPQLRDMIQAQEHEPTEEALQRWSNTTKTKYDRRRSIIEAAPNAALLSMMGMDGSEESFEKALSKDISSLDPEERTLARRIRNKVYEANQFEGIDKVRTLARKAFNTVAKDTGTNSPFAEEGAFDNADDAAWAIAMGTTPEQRPYMLAMMASVAEANGQDVDNMFKNYYKSAYRAVGKMNIKIAGGIGQQKHRMHQKTLEKLAKEGADLDGNYRVNYQTMQQLGHSGETLRKNFKFERGERIVGGSIGNLGTSNVKVVVDPEYFKELTTNAENFRKFYDFRSELSDWKGAVNRVKGDNMVTNWIYGTGLNSLPEMALASNPYTLAMIVVAQKERNMQTVRKRFPKEDWDKFQGSATAGAVAYAGMSRLSNKILFGKMPALKSWYTSLPAKWAMETVEELTQDSSFSLARKAYELADADMPDVQLFGKGGELTEVLKTAPRMSLEVLPFVLMGFGGSKAVAYMDNAKALQMLADQDLLKKANFDEDDMVTLMSIPSLEGKADFIATKRAQIMDGLSLSNETETDTLNVTSTGIETTAETESIGTGKTLEGEMSLEDELQSQMGEETDQELSEEELEAQMEEGEIGGEQQFLSPKRRTSTPSPKDMKGSDVSIVANPDGLTFTISNGEVSLEAKSPEEAAEAAQSLNPTPVRTVARKKPVRTEREMGSDMARATQALQSPTRVSGLEGDLDLDSVENRRSAFGDPIDWEMSPVDKAHAKNPVSNPQMVRAAENVLKVLGSRTKLRFGGRAVSSKAEGVYFLKARLIRVRRHDGAAVVAHEVGHAIEDQFLEGGFGDAKWVKVRKTSPELAKELEVLGNRLYKGKAPEGTTLSEGFAEYTRMLFEGTHDMGKEAPLTHKWFTENILDQNPKVAKAIQKAQETYSTYANQGARKRGEAGIAYPDGFLKFAGKNVIDEFSGLADKFVDALYPLKRLHDVATDEYINEKAKNKKFKIKMPEGNPFELATTLAMTHDAVTRHMLEDGMVDFVGNRYGKETSLKAILKPIADADERQDFTLYLWAKRTLALAKNGKKRKDWKKRDSGLSVEDAIQIFEELDSPLYQLTASKIYDWNNSVLEYAAQSSNDYKIAVGKIRQMDSGDYIPLFREFEAFDEAYKSSSSGRTAGAATGKLVKTLKGSTRRIKDPFTSMVSQAREIILRAHQRAVLEKTLDLVESGIPAMGNSIIEVAKDKLPAAARSVADLLDEVAGKVEDVEAREALEEARDIMTEEQLERVVTFWGEAYDPPNKLENPIIPIYRDGKRRWYEVDRSVYTALMTMEAYRLPNKYADMLIGTPNRMFKMGTTGYRASFAMVTNPLRDFSTLVQNTRSNATPHMILGTWMKTMGECLFHGLSGGTWQNTEWMKTYRQLGLEMSTQLGADTRPTAGAVKGLFGGYPVTKFKGKTIRLVRPNQILSYVRDVFQYAESATRITEMKLIAKQAGWNPETEQLTQEQLHKLAIAAKQVTTNFTAAGTQMRWINQVSPFSNAQVQGVRAHVDAAKRNPLRFFATGIAKSAIAVGLWLRYHDEEWWREMPLSEKYRYNYIPMGDELVRIPRAFEVDGFFMALPMAMLDAIAEDNPQEAVEWAKAFTSSFIPSAPTSVSTVYEIGANQDLFFDRPIVPEGEERDFSHDKWVHEQYGANTTKVSIKLGKMFGVSPRKIDHSIRGFLGGAGYDVVSWVGQGGASGERARQDRDFQLSELPVVGTLFQSAGKSSFAPKAVTELYEKSEWAAGSKKSLKLDGKAETPKDRQLRLMLKDATGLLSAIGQIEKNTANVTHRRELNQMQTDIAREAVDAFNKKENARASFAKWKSEVQKLQVEESKKKD